MFKTILILSIPLLIAVISYKIYTSPNDKSVYYGKKAWLIDISAMVVSVIMIINYAQDLFLYLIANVMGVMHLMKFVVKLKNRDVEEDAGEG